MKRRSRARKRAPALTLGHVALWAASLGLGAFGVAGWVASGDNLAAQILLGSAAGLAACVIPATVHHVGRGWVSLLLAIGILPFGFIAAYSTHHANEVLIEAPRKAKFTAEAEATVRTWATQVETAQAALSTHAPFVPPSDMPAGRVRENRATWNETHATLKAAWAEAREEHAKAVATRDARAAAYTPMASETVVWLVSGTLDAGIALCIAVLSVVMRRDETAKPAKPKQAAKKPKAREAKATAPRGIPNWKPKVVS